MLPSRSRGLSWSIRPPWLIQWDFNKKVKSPKLINFLQEFLFGDRSFTIRAKPHSSVLAPYIHCIQPFVLLFFAAKSAMYAISLVYNMGRHQKKKTIRNSFQSMKIIIWMLMPLSIGWIWFLPDAVITVLGKNNTVNAASSIKDLEYSVICFSELTSYSVLALIVRSWEWG